MTTIGDSFAIVALLLGVGFTAWALYLATALTFRNKSELARQRIVQRPWMAFVQGVIVTSTLGLTALVLVGLPSQPAKLVGTVGVLGLIAVSALGGAGLSLHISDRIRSSEPNLSDYAGLNRAAMLVVVASFFPFVGWFLIAPVLFLINLGAGMSTLVARTRHSVEAV